MSDPSAPGGADDATAVTAHGATDSGTADVATRGALVRSSAVVAVGTALSRVTGLVRLVAILYALELTRLSDSYNAANTMPNLVYELLLGGVLSATLVPVFVGARDRGDDDATSAVVSTAAVALVIVTVVGLVLAPELVRVFSSQVADPAEAAAQQQVATDLLRWFMPQVLFYGFITVVTALLHSRRSFAAPAFAPVLNNIVVSALFFSLPTIIGRDLDTSGSLLQAVGDTQLITLMGLGTTAGVAAMALGLVPALRRTRIRLRMRPDWRNPAVRQVIRLSGWTVGYVVSNQIALFVVLALANGSGPGELSAYQAAFVFFQLPHGLVAVSVMTTFLPELTEAARRDDPATFADRFALGVRMMAVLILPATAGYVALSTDVVALLPIGSASVELTAGVLVAFAIGLLPFSVYLFTLRGFYARTDTRTPFLVNVVENSINVALAFPLVAWAGVRGLGVAYSSAYSVAAVIALVLLARRVPGLIGRSTVDPLVRMALAAVACGAVAWLVANAMSSYSELIRVPVAGAAGAAAYLVVAWFLRVEEIAAAGRIIAARVGRPSS